MGYQKILIRSGLFIVGITSLTLISPVFAASSGLSLSQNLSLGTQSSDVVTLQQILNANPATEVAQNGPGSPGNETNYFGIKTQAAVMAFQSLHTSQVLSPAGLSSPTGFVGPLTRSALNNSLSNLSGSTYTSNSNVIFATTTILGPVFADPLAPYRPTAAEQQLNIYSTDQSINSVRQDLSNTINAALASHTKPNIDFQKYNSILKGVTITSITHVAVAGSAVTISGREFLATNNIYIGPNFVIRNVSPDLSGNISFILPSLPAGRYDVVVQNANGISNSTFLVIEDRNSIPVSIANVSPNPIHFGSTITITGSGFATSGNEIITTFGTIKNASSTDGKTLMFVFAPEQLKGLAAAGTGTRPVMMGIQVVSNSGYTLQPTQVKVGL